jgi:acyl dehydratase
MSDQALEPADLADLVGQEIGVSSWHLVDQARIDAFAACTEDHQWIHVDVERAARESPFGGTVAHGFLTLSLLAPTSFELLMSRIRVRQAVNYGLDTVRFIAPVRAGKRVRNHIRLLAVEEKEGGWYLLTTGHSIEIEGEDKPALVAQALAMIR